MRSEHDDTVIALALAVKAVMMAPAPEKLGPEGNYQGVQRYQSGGRYGATKWSGDEPEGWNN
jgi:hypothetical protein